MGELAIDAFEFCRLEEHRDGALAISSLARLHSESPSETRTLAWSLVGGVNHVGYPQLTLGVEGVISLTCQRCLEPVDFALASQSVLVLAKTEEEADDMEALLADDAVDVVAVTKKIDIAELIEDEALLAIPQSIRHESCPGGTNAALVSAEKPSAFAALKNLKL